MGFEKVHAHHQYMRRLHRRVRFCDCGVSFRVVIEPLGETIKVEDNQTILDAALRAGVNLPHACGHGLCSSCRVTIVEGMVDLGNASPFALLDMERSNRQALACCTTPMSDLIIEADVNDDQDAEVHRVRDFTGVVSKIEIFSPRIKGLFIAVEDNGIEFQAGQYVSVKIPGLKGAPRSFSIANPPSESSLVELNVCLVPGGKGTQWLHDELKVGDELEFSGPYGHFHAHPSQPGSMLFLVGGSGLSCTKSIILDLIEKGETRSITLIYGARNQDELYYRELFEQLAKEHPNFSFIPALSDEPEGSSWQGRRGFVPDVAKDCFDEEFADNIVYLCGPPAMIDACIMMLTQSHLVRRDLYMENFYTEADRYRKPASLPLRSI